jgi:hypothetical protein
VLRERIELSTSPLPRECSTTELPQLRPSGFDFPERGRMSHRPGFEARGGLEIRNAGARLSRQDVPNGCRFDERIEHAFWPLRLPARYGTAKRTLKQGTAGQKLRQHGGV